MWNQRRRSRVCCYLAVLLVVPGCGGEGGRSAGADVPRLELANELRIGSADDPDYSLTYFGQLAVDPRGRIYTLHYESQLVRVHDETGRLVRKLGGKGEGPGEFKSARSMGFLGDTLWVFDGGTYRVSYFDAPTGELLASERLPVDLGGGLDDTPPRPAGLLPDGTMLARTIPWSNLVASGDITEMTMFRWTRDGEPIDTLAVQPLEHSTWEVVPADGAFQSYMSQPFGDAEIVAISPTPAGDRPRRPRSARRGRSGLPRGRSSPSTATPSLTAASPTRQSRSPRRSSTASSSCAPAG